MMGGILLLEFSLRFTGLESGLLWMIFDLVNYLRGPLYFFFYVLNNKRVRDSLLGRFWDNKEKETDQDTPATYAPLQLSQI